MLIDFFYTLRSAKLPVSVKEYLTLIEALQAGVVGPESDGAYGLDDFYYLARTALVHKFPTLRLSGTFEGYWPFKAAAIALFGAAIGAVYPAFKAARKDPIDALAYE